MNVHDHLEAASRLPWRWGGGDDGFEGEDCTLFAANWALALTGKDPGEGIRGMYSTERAALAIVARAGGVEAFVDRQLRRDGWLRIAAAPRDGDIGVVLAPQVPDGRMGAVPAVRAGGLWVGRSPRGQVAYDFEAVSVWRWGDYTVVDLGPPPPRQHVVVEAYAQQCAGTTMFGDCRPAQMQQTGIIESIILFGITAALPGLSNAAIGLLTTALTGLVVSGISYGLQYLLTPKPPKPEDGKAPLTQAIPPRIYAVGESRVAGAYMLFEEKNGGLFTVSALCGHRVNAITRIYFGEDYVTAYSGDYFGTAGAVVTDTNIDDGRFHPDCVRIGLRLGEVPETAYDFLVDVLGGEGIWTNDHRGDGQASIALACRSVGQKEQLKRFPTGIPHPSCRVEGALCWDPTDEEQDPEDESTWTWTKNAARILIWHECFNPFGIRRDYTKAILPVLDVWQEEIAICDEDVDRAGGGTEKRYECGGWATTENDPKAAENAILNACDGWLCERGDGALILRVGKFREELVETLTDDDIIGYFVQNDVAEEDEFNRLVPKFTYPATDYTTSDADYLEDTTAQMSAGRVLSKDMDLSWVQQWRQARRLLKREWLRSRQKKRGTLDVRLSGINAVFSPWVRIESTYKVPRLNGAIIDNRRAVIALMKGGFQMEWVLHPTDGEGASVIDAWTPASDEGAAPPVPARPTSAGVETPVVDGVVAVTNGSSVYIRVLLVEPSNAEVRITVRYRVADIGGGTPGAWVEQQFEEWSAAAGIVAVNTNPVPTNQDLDIEVAYIATGGTYSSWADGGTVTSTLDGTPPGAVTGVSATPGTGTVDLAWTSPNSANYVGAVIRRNTVDNFAGAAIVRVEYGSASTADAWQDSGLAADDYWYWVSSVNGSGFESSAVATGSVTVT